MKEKVSKLQRKLYDIAKAEPERRFHSLYDKIQRMDILQRSWEIVMKNGGSPGIDGISIKQLKKDGIETMLTEIQSELKTGTYRPSPLKRVYIPKANGKQRPLSIPAVKDRITQTAIKIIIEPIFETQFEPNSFGFRPNRSAHDAVDEIVKYLNFGCEHIIDADITACFDNIDKHRLMKQVARRISDGAMLHIIRQFLDAGIMEDNELHEQTKGTPQGSPLSPLLANIYLDQLDKKWKASGLWKGEDAHLIRYADDGAPRRKWRKNNMSTGIKRPISVYVFLCVSSSIDMLVRRWGRAPWIRQAGLEVPNHRKLLFHNGNGSERYGKRSCLTGSGECQ